MSQKPMLPLGDVAKHFSISDKLALKLVSDGSITAVKIGNRWRVSAEEFERLKREGTKPQPSASASAESPSPLESSDE